MYGRVTHAVLVIQASLEFSLLDKYLDTVVVIISDGLLQSGVIVQINFVDERNEQGREGT